jgi:hypothetical protein
MNMFLVAQFEYSGIITHPFYIAWLGGYLLLFVSIFLMRRPDFEFWVCVTVSILWGLWYPAFVWLMNPWHGLGDFFGEFNLIVSVIAMPSTFGGIAMVLGMASVKLVRLIRGKKIRFEHKQHEINST